MGPLHVASKLHFSGQQSRIVIITAPLQRSEVNYRVVLAFTSDDGCSLRSLRLFQQTMTVLALEPKPKWRSSTLHIEKFIFVR